MADADPSPSEGAPANPDWVAPNVAAPTPDADPNAVPTGWTSVDQPPGPDIPRIPDSPAAAVYGYQPPPTYANPLSAHKPGIIPLRPLGMGDILTGAVSAIRTNPGAILGITAIFAVVAGGLTLIFELMSTAIEDSSDITASIGLLSVSLVLIIGLTTATFALLIGAVSYPTSRAVQGRYPSLGRCWDRVRPRLPTLFALAAAMFALTTLPLVLIVAIFGAAGAAASLGLVVIGLLALFVVVVVLGVLFTFASFAFPIAALEGLGAMDSLRRSVVLVRPVFWRVLGISLLVSVVASIVSSVISSPATLIGSLAESLVGGAGATAVRIAVSTVLDAVGQFVTLPFVATAITLLYIDARIRTEGFDLALTAASADDPGQST